MYVYTYIHTYIHILSWQRNYQQREAAEERVGKGRAEEKESEAEGEPEEEEMEGEEGEVAMEVSFRGMVKQEQIVILQVFQAFMSSSDKP